MNGNALKTLVGIGLAALAALGIIDYNERRETNKKIGISMKELKDATYKDISASMLEKAVKEAADEQTATFMRAIRTDIMSDARQQLADETRKAVLNAKEAINKEVGERISTEASLIDMSELKRTVRSKAEEKVLTKFDGDLDEILNKANRNLTNIMDIYEGISNVVNKNNSNENKGLKFTIG